MAISAFQLPREVWFNVFRFLQPKEKGTVRSTCKFFKTVIDHPSLWRSHTVVLRNIRSYSAQFWSTLRRRKTASVIVHKASVREWEQVAASLPWLTSITVVRWSDSKALWTIQRFKNLKRLVVRSFQCPPELAGIVAPLRQLTHLCLCDLSGTPREDVFSALSQLSGLTSLSYHESDKPIPKKSFQCLLSRLPNLKHLSLKMGPLDGPLPDDYFTLPGGNRDANASPCGGEVGITKLELLSYMDPIVSPSGLDSLQRLQCLTIDYRDRAVESSTCHLRSWMRKLPCLTELTIARGYPLGTYVGAIPETLTSLTLLQVSVVPGDMRTLGSRAPGLQHLHADVWSARVCWRLLELPQLFAQLRTLQLRHTNMTEAEFLGLARLQLLEKLVVLDIHPDTTPGFLDLIHKFQKQTNYRVQVVHSLPLRNHTVCYCGQH